MCATLGTPPAAAASTPPRQVITVRGGWAANSAALEVYFDDVEGWEDNAMNGVL
ncbi:hypothetical protein ACFRIC_39235 [Streptomyces sp. NPDC056738]|uniref:hypothetical protein n=1 Tax=Streptomyces sp. NPDC056738 TaxID=3345933 RepID=UPI0036B09758